MRQKWNWRALSNWVVLIWLAVVVAGYYVMHKPITPAFVLSLMLIIWRVGVAGTIFSIAGGLGRRLLPMLPNHPLSALSLQAGLGAGMLSLGVLVVGWVGGLYAPVALFAILLMSILLRSDIRSWWMEWRSLGAVWRESSNFGRMIAGMLIVILGCMLIESLALPTHWDALVYHLALPQFYLDTHRFIYNAKIMYWGMPQTAEMLYTWAMSLAGGSGALVLGWMGGVIALTGLLGLLIQKLGLDAAWAGAGALMAGFTLAAGLAWGYTDWWTVLFGLGFLISLSNWIESERDSQLALSGILAGMALSSKYTAGILMVGGAIIITLRYRSDIPRLLRSLLWFGAPALLVFSPWLIKNIWATGNPVYPLFFPAGSMSALRLSLYQGGQPWGNWLDIPFLPARLTFWGVDGGPGYSASIGPLLLGLGVAAGLGWRSRVDSEKAVIRLALTIAASGMIIWMIAGRFSSYLLQARLYFSIFPALAALAAAGFSGLSRINQNGVRFRNVVGVLVVVVLGLNSLEVGLHAIQMGTVPTVLGFRDAETFLVDNLGWYGPAMDALRELPESSRVLMLWEPRSLYCAPLCEPDEIIDRWLRERYENYSAGARTPVEILENWRNAGYTHLLYYKLGADFIRLEDASYALDDWLALDALLNQLGTGENFGDTYILYTLSQ